MGAPTLSIDGRRATITLNRPEKRNRIEPDDLSTLTDLLDEVAANESIRAMILTNSAGPIFCAGYHLGALAERGVPPKATFTDVCDRIEHLRVPTILAANGGIHGGGTDLALSCDFRIGITESDFRMPAAAIGLQYYASGIRRYVSRLGPGVAKRLFLTAERIGAEEMVRVGILDEIVPADRLTARVDELAGAIEQLAPLALANTKAAINAVATGTADWAAIEAGHLATMRSEDHREAMRALNEKRAPEFHGR